MIADLILLVYSLILMRFQTPSPKLKRNMILVAVSIALVYAVTITTLTKSNSIVGTWYTDDTFEVPHTGFPLEHASKLVFRINGTVSAEIIDQSGRTATETYTYDLTSNTISVQADGLGYGILFDVMGNELHFGRDGMFAIYYREQ